MGSTIMQRIDRVPRRNALAIGLLVALGAVPLFAAAATVTVTSAADPGVTGSCTLRQAITTLNHGALGGAGEGACRGGSSGSIGINDTVRFALSVFPAGGANTITLTSGRIEISGFELTLDAAANGMVTVDGDHASGVFIDSASAGSSLVLSHITVANGDASAGVGAAAQAGGGIFVQHADLSLRDSVVRDNSAGQAGGGIFMGTGDLVLINSTVSGNSSTSTGGGIFNANGHTTVNNSTIAGNTSYNGGGIFYGDGGVAMNNATVSANSANSGGGIYAINGTSVVATNSIVAGNVGGDVFHTGVGGSSNLVGAVPNLNLGALADNGGATPTMLPQEASAAIDMGDDATCIATDQRGVARPQNGRCDVGAAEASVVDTIVAAYGSGGSAIVWHRFANPLIVQVVQPNGQVAAGVPLRASIAPANAAGAWCSAARTNQFGIAYLDCRGNGFAGSYAVTVKATGWASVAAASFTLTNVDDGDTLFSDGFDPPAP